MARLEARIDESTHKKLELLKQQTGLSKTEILENLIDYSRASDFRIFTETKDEKMLLIATRKYLAFLYKNATNNLNQLAHKINSSGLDETSKTEIENSFNELKKSVDKLTKEIKAITSD